METNHLQEQQKLQTTQVDDVIKEDKLSLLKPFGGFEIINSTIEDVKSLNPTGSRALKETFLKDKNNESRKSALKKRLQIMVDVLINSKNTLEILENFKKSLDTNIKVYYNNIKVALEKTEELEKSYRSLDLFFKNSETEKVKNLSLLNASMSQLQDLDSDKFSAAVRSELSKYFDKISLVDSYSLMVIPGFLGSNKVLDHWGEIAYKNKVMMITDMEDFDTPDDVVSYYQLMNFSGSADYKTNMMLTTNWLIGRKGEEHVREGKPLYVGGSAALAGKLYSTKISQPAAGYKFGILKGVEGIKFDLKLSEVGVLEKLGLIPFVYEKGNVFAYSAKTLNNGDNLGNQTYSVARVFDWVAKVMMDFLNTTAFENVTYDSKSDLKKQITKFLQSISGSNGKIEDFSILKVEQDLEKKDRVIVDISIKPFFPARSFTLQLDGKQGENNTVAWNSTINKN